MSRVAFSLLMLAAERRLMLGLLARREFPSAGAAMIDFAIVELAELDAIGARL